MNNNEGSINFSVGIDTDKFNRDLQEMTKRLEEMERRFRENTEATAQSTERLHSSINNVGKALGTLFVLGGAQQFVSQIVNVRDEFQKLEISFATMLQSKDKANKLMAEMVDLAAHTPFSMTEVAEGAKRLLAFQIPAEQVTDTLRRMGDVAAGLSVPMAQLIHVYGQVKAQGRLLTNDLYQFTNAGIPIIAELSKVTGKAENEIKDMVTTGKIGFTEIQQVFQNMTNQGGLFYNLTAEQSKSLGGQISNLKDNIEQMFNEMGKATEGTISSAISGVAYLVEHYKQVGKILSVLIASYGTYKASIIAQAAAQQIATKYGVYDVATKQLQVRATIQAMAAQIRLNAAVLANPYTLAAAAIVGLVVAIWQFSSAASAAEQAQESFNKEMGKMSELRDKEKQQIDDLLNTLKDETKTRGEQQQALLKLQALYPAIFSQYKTEAELLLNIADARQKAYASIEGNDVKRKEDYIKSLEDRLTYLNEQARNSGGDQSTLAILTKQIEITQAELAKAKRATAWTKTQNKINELSNLSPEEQRRQQALIREEINRRKNAQIGVGQKQIPLTMPAFQSTGYENFDIKDLGLINQKTDSFLKVAKAQITTFDDLLKKKAELQKSIDNIKAQLTAKGANVNDETLNKQLAEQEAALKAVNTQIEKLETKSTKKGGTKTTKAEKTPYDIEAEKQRIKRQQEDLFFTNEEQRIQQLEDGYDKEEQLIKLKYKQKAITINRLEEDALQNLIAQRKKQYEYEHGNAKGFDPSRVQLDPETQSQFNEMRILNGDDQLQAYDKLYKDVLDKYKTYEEEVTALNKKYAQERTILEKKYSGDVLKDKLEKNKKAQDKEMRELAKKYKPEGDIIGRLFDDFSTKTTKQLEELFEAATKGFEEVKKSGDAEFLAEYRRRLDELKAKIKETQPLFKRLAFDFKTAFTATGVEQKEAINNAIQGIGQINQMTGQLSQALSQIGSATGNESLKKTAEVLSTVSDNLSKSASLAQIGSQVGGGWGAAIGGVIGLVWGGISNGIKKVAKEREEAAKIAQNHLDIERLITQQVWERKNLRKDDNDEVYGDKETQRVRNQIREITSQTRKLKNDVNNELQDIRVITGKKMYGGIRGWFKRAKDFTEPLLQRYKELVTKDGELNIELAKTLLQQNLIEGEQAKNQLKKMVEEQENLNKLREEVNNYFKRVMGEFGNDLVSAVWDAAKQGEDAMQYFGKSVDKIISNMAKKLIFEQYFKDVLEEMAKKSKEAYANASSEEDAVKRVQEIYASYKGTLENRMRSAELASKAIQENSKNLGIAEDNAKQRTAQTKGFQAMGQDTANELNARFTLMTELQRVSNEEIKKMTASALKAKENLDTLRENSLKSLFHLANIDANTYTLHQMSKDMANIKNSFEEIKLHGIKVK